MDKITNQRTVTVGQLIDALKEYDEDAVVIVYDSEHDFFHELTDVRINNFSGRIELDYIEDAQ